jgi:hypothetical protein
MLSCISGELSGVPRLPRSAWDIDGGLPAQLWTSMEGKRI